MLEEGEIFRCDEDCYGEAFGGELMSQVKEWCHVPLRRIRKNQYVCAGSVHSCFSA